MAGARGRAAVSAERVRRGPAAKRTGDPARRKNDGGAGSVQSIKSAQTRKIIIEAAIRSLIKFGYSRTTMPRVAEEAGVSRGAMMHHFKSSPAVIQAVITYLHEKRLRAFEKAVATLPPGEDHLNSALMAYWDHVTHPKFAAFHELAVAARTDEALAAILLPAQQQFARQWYRLALELFPEWRQSQQNFDLALALCQSTLEGMAINRLGGTLSDALTNRMLRHLEDQLRMLRR